MTLAQPTGAVQAEKQKRRTQMVNTVVGLETIKGAVQLACRAPSLHNSQPWRWVTDGNSLSLYLDPTRSVVSTDRSGREALIGCGAVLDHLRVAIAAAGWAADIDRFPNPNDRNHLASLRFRAMTAVTDEQRHRAEAIARRRTDRLPFAAPPNWQTIESTLRASFDEAVAHLYVLRDAVRPELAQASRFTESLRLYDKWYQDELDWWTGHFETTVGIPLSSLISAAERERVDVGRVFPAARDSERRTSIQTDHSKVLVISTDCDTRECALSAGEMLSRILLECTMAGMATCTLTHMTELATSRHVIRTLTESDAWPQLLIRVGLAPMQEELPPTTPRRPLREALEIRA
jgi:hypothetical protein